MVKQDISRARISWDKVPDLVIDRVTWKELTALCVKAQENLRV